MVDKVEGQPGQSDQPSKSATEGSGALKKSVQDLVSEWDQPTSKGTDGDKVKSSEPAKSSASDKTQISDEVRAEIRAQIQDEEDFKGLVSEIKGDLGVDDRHVKRWIDGRAAEEPNLNKVWRERRNNQAAFRQLTKALSDEYRADLEVGAKSISKKGGGEAEGEKASPRDSLSAAVRNAREASPSSGYEDLSWAGLNENQFALKKAEVFRLQKAGKLA